MKALMALATLLVIAGVLYGLAFLGIIPAQKLADRSPAAAKVLIAMKLAKPKPKARPSSATPPDPKAQALADQEKQIAEERAQLEKDKEALAAQKQTQSATQAAVPDPNETAPPDTTSKLIAMYATMAPEDIVKIMIKQPDSVIVNSLMQLDDKKAGKILAALPPDRAAKISTLMYRPAAHTAASAAPPPPKTTL